MTCEAVDGYEGINTTCFGCGTRLAIRLWWCGITTGLLTCGPVLLAATVTQYLAQRYSGFLNVSTADTYNFTLTAADGALLFLDDQPMLFINNNSAPALSLAPVTNASGSSVGSSSGLRRYHLPCGAAGDLRGAVTLHTHLQELMRRLPCAAYGRGRTTSVTAMQLVSGLHHLVLEYFFEVPGDTSNPTLVSRRPTLGRSTPGRAQSSLSGQASPQEIPGL